MSADALEPKFWPNSVPNLIGHESRYLLECVETSFVSSVGPFVRRFEESVMRVTNSVDSVAVSSGTAALHLALLGAGVRPGDLVIVPTLSFIASANAISMCGATPWFFDVSEESWTLDPKKLEDELRRSVIAVAGQSVHKASGQTVRAVLPVYTMGMPADMDSINTLANEFHLAVVADAAAALGASYRGRGLGSLAPTSAASFNGNKTFTCGGGGAIFGSDRDILGRLSHISKTARVGEEYVHDEVAFNYRMTNIQAAVGTAQLERFDEFLATKRTIASAYRRLSDRLGLERAFPQVDWAESACWQSGLLLAEHHNRHEVQRALQEFGIEAKGFWRPLHLQEPYATSPLADVSYSERIWDRVLTLPSSTCISGDDLAEIEERVLRALG